MKKTLVFLASLWAHVALASYCGGVANDSPGVALKKSDLREECERVYGDDTSVVLETDHAYGWRCELSDGSRDSLDIQGLCEYSAGDNAVASLTGMGPYDWLCVSPEDLDGKIVPIILLTSDAGHSPRYNRNISINVGRLIGGVRKFYEDKTGIEVEGTSPLFLPVTTTNYYWQGTAIATEQGGGDFEKDRFGYYNAAVRNLEKTWQPIIDNSNAHFGIFVAYGENYQANPTTLGAAAARPYFVSPPANVLADCIPGSATNSEAYELAFYGTAHEFGHTLGLKHTDEYENAPADFARSIMFQGRGTFSELFDFEVREARRFLRNWN